MDREIDEQENRTNVSLIHKNIPSTSYRLLGAQGNEYTLYRISLTCRRMVGHYATFEPLMVRHCTTYTMSDKPVRVIQSV